MKVCVIIPTYNEARAIGSVVSAIRREGLEAVVVDDGSCDNTVSLARDSGAIVLKNPANQGKGASLVKGFKYALERDFTAVITMDGDGQHLPEDIPSLMGSASRSPAGIIIGNRMLKTGAMPWPRVLTNRFMSWLVSLIVKQQIPDSQCGFRLIRRELLGRLNLLTTKYETETEILIKAAQMGFAIESVAINTVYGEEKSQINSFLDTARFIRFMMREIWTMPF
ncbi:MAG: glycosyltransferase family 2 protein [Candidatus Omnitrophota bacterium]